MLASAEKYTYKTLRLISSPSTSLYTVYYTVPLILYFAQTLGNYGLSLRKKIVTVFFWQKFLTFFLKSNKIVLFQSVILAK